MRRPTDFSERETRRYRGENPGKLAAIVAVAAAFALAAALMWVISLLL